MKKKRHKRKSIVKILATLLCVSLVVQNVPLNALASEAVGDLTEEEQSEDLRLEQSVETGESVYEEQPEETVQEPVSEKDEMLETMTSMETDIGEIVEESDDATESTVQTEAVSEVFEEVTTEVETATTDEVDTESATEEETTELIETEEDFETMYEAYLEEYEELMDNLTSANTTYRITEKQLFMQAPQYLLKDNPHDKYLSRCFEYTRQAMNGVSSTQTWWATFMKGLKDGTEFLTKEIASSCGLTDSNYDKQKKDMAGELVREYMGNEEYLSEKAEALSKKLKTIDKIADADLKLKKAQYKKQLKETCTAMTDADVDEAVDAAFDKVDKISGYTDKAFDVFEIITSVIATQELELEVIDDLIVSLQNSNDKDLYEGLIMIRNDVTSDIGTYILQNYLTDKALGKIRDLFKDAASDLTGIKLDVTAKLVVDIVVGVGVWCYEKYNPSVDDIMHTTIMYNYALTLDNAVLEYKMSFYKDEAEEKDIERFKVAYTAELCAVKLMMKYAKGLTSSKALKNTLDSYRESIGKSPVTCTDYVNRYRLIATEDINAGILTVTDESATQKTPDGTVIDKNYDPTESIKAKYAEIQKKYPPDVSKTWKESYGGAIQCFGFARMVFNLLFGCDMPSAYRGSKRYEYVNNNNVTVIGQLSGSNVTANNMKKLVSQGKLGDVTQGYGVPYGQHTMILQEVKDTGAVFYQCNYLNEDCLIYTQFHTWESLANRYGKGDSTSGNGFTLYRANNYGTIYGDGSELFYDDSVNFVINDGVLVKYNGWQSHVVIPDTVTAIGDNAFKNNTTMMTVEIPDGVTSIGNSAFYGCTNLVGVVIPDSVETIGSQAFYGCTNLMSVQLPGNEKFSTLRERVFQKCIRLKRVEIPNTVTSIGNSVFEDCEKLTDVDLPNRLTAIGYQVFTNVPITKITIPKSLEKVSGYYNNVHDCGAFYNCITLKEVNFEEGVIKIPNYLFAGCNGIEKIIVPNTVTSIEESAFEHCINLEKVEIPDSVISIENNVFKGCEKLTDVDLPNRLVTIGYQVFTNVPITKITIPKSLEKVSGYYNNVHDCGAFYNCTTLKEVNFEEGVTKISKYLFAGCNGIEKIIVPNTVTSIEERAFDYCINLEEVGIPNSVVDLGDNVFRNCKKLIEVNIPDTITSMGNYIFSGCTSLKTAKLPNIRVNITEGMFQNCTSLTTIDLPKTVTTIRQYAFQNAGLTELTLPENVTTIERNAFDGCTALAKVTLNSNLKTIGNYAFRNNDALTEITIPNSVTTIGDYAFQDSDALTTVTISDSVTSIGQYIFAHCDSLKDVKLGTGITKIPAYAFNLCPALEKIVLPYRITTVDANAFTNCTKLTEVTIPRGTTNISTSAFSYPDRLTIYGISGTYAETYANQIGAKFVNREVNATDVTLNSTTLSMITGAKHTLVMSVTPSDFTDEVVWKSSDTNILTVDNMGVITAKAVGTTNVRVAVGDKTANCTVTVVQPVTGISLNRSSLSLDAFEDYTLAATVSPSNAADKSVEWTTSDEKIAIVSQTGKVTPLSKGTATITVTAKDGSGKSARCTVTVTSEGQLCTQSGQLESEHNYANNTNKVWKYVYNEAKTLEITFDSRTNVDKGFDFIYIYDKDNKEIKKATGTELANQTIKITGDTVKIKLVSDEAITAWGFKVTKISIDGKIIDSGDEEPEETETSTESSSEEESSAEESSKEESSSEESSSEEESNPDEDVKDGLCITGLKAQIYTGNAIKQDIKVYYNKHLLQEGADYTLSYKNNKNVGKASVTIKSKKNLTGVVTKTFDIQPRKIDDTDVIIEDAVFNYDKKSHKKAPVITYNGKALKEGRDYKVTDYGLGDYTSSGTYTMKVEGIGNFTGVFDGAKVIITDKDHNLSKAKIAKIPVQEYKNGTKVELPDQLIQVMLNKTTLQKDVDYTVSYANNINAGKATLIIKGKGSYAGTKKVNFTIKRTPTTLSDSMVANKESINSVAIQKNGAMPKPKL